MKNAIHRIAFGAALAIGIAALPCASYASAPHLQEHHDEATHEDHPEYRTNRYYRVGNREGYQDYQRKEQRKEHNHKYRNDDDRHAHDYGYQQGWNGTRYNEHH